MASIAFSTLQLLIARAIKRLFEIVLAIALASWPAPDLLVIACAGRIGADEPKDFHDYLRLLSANEKFNLATLALVMTSTRFKPQVIKRGRDYDPREDLHP
jgi:hypothetical protein